MDHFLEVRVLPDPEIPVAQILNVAANRLHIALVSLRANDIGVSFPMFGLEPIGLGDRIRLHGTDDRLTALLKTGSLTSIRDYVAIDEVQPVPRMSEYRIVRRVQADASVDRIRRRQMRRHGWSEQEARERVPASSERQIALPYLRMKSSSTGQPFRLFIEHQECRPTPVVGQFNAYGLSVMATVPWF
jgi:CRISPR-associated endonuclease Csy4